MTNRLTARINGHTYTIEHGRIQKDRTGYWQLIRAYVAQGAPRRPLKALYDIWKSMEPENNPGTAHAEYEARTGHLGRL